MQNPLPHAVCHWLRQCFPRNPFAADSGLNVLRTALTEEQESERAADEAYWQPLKKELE